MENSFRGMDDRQRAGWRVGEYQSAGPATPPHPTERIGATLPLDYPDPYTLTRVDPMPSDPMSSYIIPAATTIGHVHLQVADLERALGFYVGVLGFQLTQRYGAQAAFVSAGGYHHHIGLNTWKSLGGSPPPPSSTGLYHLAILYPSRPDLAVALRRVLDAGIALDGASDHGVSEALYLRDPDDNGVELYRDRPPAEWPRAPDGTMLMGTSRLDLEALLHEAG